MPSSQQLSKDKTDGVGNECVYGDLLQHATKIAHRYLGEIGVRHAGVKAEALHNLSRLSGPLPPSGEDPKSILNLLDDFGSPATVASMGPRFFGGVVGGTFPIALAAHWVADSWDQNACLFDISPVAAYLEDVVLAWLRELLCLPSGSGGAFVTGTQMGDVTALAAARNAVLRKTGWDANIQGIAGAPPIKVIVGEEVHATMLKAIRVLGFGMDQVLSVPADGQGRLKPEKIPRVAGPVIICAQAGNVNTGAFDPFVPICDLARTMDAWVHVDGAFGVWAATSPGKRHLVEGVSAADSWAFDAHKWLNVPHDSGIVMVRKADDLLNAMTINAAYYPEPTAKREPMQWGPESSRRARAIDIWATLRFLGSEGVSRLIERTCDLASRFADGFRAAGFEVLNDVVLNQVLVSFGSDQRTTEVVAAIQAEGTCWCGATLWKGRKAMRVSVSSWSTTNDDVDLALDAILAIAGG